MRWTIAPLGKITTVMSGTTPDTDKPGYWNGDKVWVTPTDLGKLRERVILSSSRLITDEGRASCNLPLVPAGSVVMSSRAPIGHLAVAGCDLHTNQGCKSFVCGEELDPDFLYFTLKHRMPDIQALGSGATFVEVSKSALEEFEISYPKIGVQRQIATRLKAQLSEVDKARQAAEERYREFNNLRRAILSNGLHWQGEFVPLTHVADTQLGKMLSPIAKTGKSSYLYLRNQNVQWGRFVLSNLATMDFSDREREKFDLRYGDLLICEGGEPGRCAVWRCEISNCYYQKALHRLRPHDSEADSEFLCYWIWYQAITGAFEDQSSKTTIAHLPQIRLEQLLVPDMKLTEQFCRAAKIKDQFQQIDTARSESAKQLAEINLLPQKILAKAFDFEG